MTKTLHPQGSPRTSAHYVEEASDSRDHSEPLEEVDFTAEEYVLEDDGQETVSGTEQDQSYANNCDYATITNETDSVPVFESRGHTPAPRLTYEDRQTRKYRPGWCGRSSHRPERGDRYPVDRGPGDKNHSLVCFKCYENRHQIPLCFLTWKGFNKVVLNYEALTPMERFGLPMTSYLCAKNTLVDPPWHTPAVSSNGKGSNIPDTKERRNPGSPNKGN